MDNRLSVRIQQYPDEIAKMQKEDITESMYSEYDEQFVAVAILLFLALVLEMVILERKNPLFSRLKLFS